MIEFSFKGYELEFEPGDSWTAGELEAWNDDGGDSFGAKIDISSTQARTRWANEAVAMYPDTFADVNGLKRALGELYKHVREKQRIAEAKAAAENENDESEDPLVEPAAEGTEAFEKAME